MFEWQFPFLDERRAAPIKLSLGVWENFHNPKFKRTRAPPLCCPSQGAPAVKTSYDDSLLLLSPESSSQKPINSAHSSSRAHRTPCAQQHQQKTKPAQHSSQFISLQAAAIHLIYFHQLKRANDLQTAGEEHSNESTGLSFYYS